MEDTDQGRMREGGMAFRGRGTMKDADRRAMRKEEKKKRERDSGKGRK